MEQSTKKKSYRRKEQHYVLRALSWHQRRSSDSIFYINHVVCVVGAKSKSLCRHICSTKRELVAQRSRVDHPCRFHSKSDLSQFQLLHNQPKPHPIRRSLRWLSVTQSALGAAVTQRSLPGSAGTDVLYRLLFLFMIASAMSMPNVNTSPSRSDWEHQPEYQSQLPYLGHDRSSGPATNTGGEQLSSMGSRPFTHSSQNYNYRFDPSRSTAGDHETSISLLAQPVDPEGEALASISQQRVEAFYVYQQSNYGATMSDPVIPRFPIDLPGAQPEPEVEGGEEAELIKAESEDAADNLSPQAAGEGRVDKKKTNRFR